LGIHTRQAVGAFDDDDEEGEEDVDGAFDDNEADTSDSGRGFGRGSSSASDFGRRGSSASNDSR
jgi:hypothetical protein